MKQVYYSDVSDTAPALPSTAVEGYPQDANLSANASATVPGAYWFHMISSEIENAIRNGGLTPDASDLTQLSQVIATLTNNDRTMTAHATLVTSTNMQSICGSNMNGLTPQRNYILATNLTNAGMQNLPVDNLGGTVICWSRASSWQSGSAQMMCGSDGNFYIRQYWSNTWRAWRAYKSWDEVEPAISACVRGVSTTVSSGSINDLPLNRIYAIANNEAVTDTPEAGVGGFYVTLCRTQSALSSACGALYIDFNKGLWYRISNSSGWTEWKQVAASADMKAIMHGVSLIGTSNRDDICQGDLDNVLPNTIYTVANGQEDADLAHQPGIPGTGGLLMTMSRTNSNVGGSSRLFFGFDREAYHSIAVSAGWSPWRRLISQDVLKIAMLGDSIAYGGRNNFKGYVGDLGMPYLNLGIAGRLLSNAVADRDPISEEMDSLGDFVPDIFISNGGVNDYNHNAVLGVVPTQPVDATCDTVIGGLQHLLYRQMVEFPRCQRFFLLGHRTLDWSYTANSAGYTQAQLYEALRETCKVYATTVIDVFNQSSMNTALDVFKDDVLCDSDGIHPEALGYKLYYVPLVRQAIMLGTAK